MNSGRVLRLGTTRYQWPSSIAVVTVPMVIAEELKGNVEVHGRAQPWEHRDRLAQEREILRPFAWVGRGRDRQHRDPSGTADVVAYMRIGKMAWAVDFR